MIITDTTVTHTTHRRTIEIDGPTIKTKFTTQSGRVKFKADCIKLVWHDDVPPEFCQVHGYTKKGRRTRRPYSLAKAPTWLKEAINARKA